MNVWFDKHRVLLRKQYTSQAFSHILYFRDNAVGSIDCSMETCSQLYTKKKEFFTHQITLNTIKMARSGKIF